MDIKSALFYVEVIVGVFLFIVISYFLIKALIVILKVIGYIAKILFKVLYVLLMMALAVSGAGYAIYTGLLFLNHESLSILWTLVGVFFMLLGVNGLVNFVKNGGKFSSEILSTYSPSYVSSSSTSSKNDRYPLYPDPNEPLNWFERRNEEARQAKEDAKENAWQAKQDREREEKNQAIENQKIASWNADQEKWAEFDRKRAEDEEYNRRAREG